MFIFIVSQTIVTPLFNAENVLIMQTTLLLCMFSLQYNPVDPKHTLRRRLFVVKMIGRVTPMRSSDRLKASQNPSRLAASASYVIGGIRKKVRSAETSLQLSRFSSSSLDLRPSALLSRQNDSTAYQNIVSGFSRSRIMVIHNGDNYSCIATCIEHNE